MHYANNNNPQLGQAQISHAHIAFMFDFGQLEIADNAWGFYVYTYEL